jgi:hypothetical protein
MASRRTVRVKRYRRTDGTRVRAHNRRIKQRSGTKVISTRTTRSVSRNGTPVKTRTRQVKYMPIRRNGTIIETPWYRLRRWFLEGYWRN